MKVAAYLYSPPGKDYDFDLMLSELSTHSDEEIHEVYADGWTAIPNGLSELIADLSKYDKVILLTFEGLTTSDLRTLVDYSHIYCCYAADIGWAESHNTKAFRELCSTIEAESYYTKLRSMKIRVGMKKSDKHIGNVPFGHVRNDDGQLQEVPHLMDIANKVRQDYIAGLPVAVIAHNTGLLSVRQVYGLMEYWGVKRG